MADVEEFDFGDNVDVSTFEQILEMDDGDDGDSHDFSRSIVFGFFDQASDTFDKMFAAIKSEDLESLSSLGHFLKGSSATLGFVKVRDQCEKIQHYGKQMDETGTSRESDTNKCLRLIDEATREAQKQVNVVKGLMDQYYDKLDGT